MVHITLCDSEMDSLLSLLEGIDVTTKDDLESTYVSTTVEGIRMSDNTLLLSLVFDNILTLKSTTITMEVPIQLFVSDTLFHNSRYIRSKCRYTLEHIHSPNNNRK